MAKLSADGKSVTVVAGDCLWDIAKKYLGDATKYKELANINNIPNPNLIYVGQVIKLTKDGSSSGGTDDSNKPKINQFGLVSNQDNTLFATWTWSKDNTASYKVLWTYDTGDGVWFVGQNNDIGVDKEVPEAAKQCTYSIPDNAITVKFKVKPISETKDKNGKETNYWTAEWSTEKSYDVKSGPPDEPQAPTVTIDKYKLTAEIKEVTVDATEIEFQVVKNNTSVFKTGKAKINDLKYVSYSCTVDAGAEYKVRCRSIRNGKHSEWTAFTDNVASMPGKPSGFTEIRGTSETSVFLKWNAVGAATKYEIQYTTVRDNFDLNSDDLTSKTVEDFTYCEIEGLETGKEYFFRLRAGNNAEDLSDWSDIQSIKLGSKPAAPTTWSSTTTAVTGEALNLYWVHNSEDGSSQTYGRIEITTYAKTTPEDKTVEYHTIQNSTDEDEKDKTSVFALDTSSFVEGIVVEWRVQTAGITLEYGDWSIMRTIDIYAPATLEMRMIDLEDNAIDTLTSFPFRIYALGGPKTQQPIGYHVSIVSKEAYETTDRIGNEMMVNAGDEVYSKYFDINSELLIELTPAHLDLENNMHYTVVCTVSMNSGLTATAEHDFSVAWKDDIYEPTMEIGIDTDSWVAHIRPYCEHRVTNNYIVELVDGVYVRTDTVITDTIYDDWIEIKDENGEVIEVQPPASVGRTANGELVYAASMQQDTEFVDIYYCEASTAELVEDIWLSVYRREYDGRFTEIATGLDNARNTTVTDPHPALDYARYRIVATSKTTGAVSYYDPPGYPVGGTAIVIQWAEDWSDFEVTEEDASVQPPWSGSLLELPYNIEVSDSHRPDVSLVEYAGREHPVAFYGTHLGVTSSWNTAIPKSDKETLYGLRRLAKWMGNVYVREPSGSGYWANIVVAFNQKSLEVTIPVSFNITRVEGGM